MGGAQEGQPRARQRVLQGPAHDPTLPVDIRCHTTHQNSPEKGGSGGWARVHVWRATGASGRVGAQADQPVGGWAGRTEALKMSSLGCGRAALPTASFPSRASMPPAQPSNGGTDCTQAYPLGLSTPVIQPPPPTTVPPLYPPSTSWPTTWRTRRHPGPVGGATLQVGRLQLGGCGLGGRTLWAPPHDSAFGRGVGAEDLTEWRDCRGDPGPDGLESFWT